MVAPWLHNVPVNPLGALMQSPVHGGKLKSFDFDAIRNMPGVIGVAVIDPSEPRKRLKTPLQGDESLAQSSIVVVAEHYWQARKALEALPLETSARTVERADALLVLANVGYGDLDGRVNVPASEDSPLGALFARMFWLQVVRHDYFSELSQGNRIRIDPIPPAGIMEPGRRLAAPLFRRPPWAGLSPSRWRCRSAPPTPSAVRLRTPFTRGFKTRLRSSGAWRLGCC